MSTQAEGSPDNVHAALGAELRAAREQRGLSLHQASQELHVSDLILDSLERGDYVQLGAPIFVRGHLRGYARLLGLDEEQVLAHYEQQSGKPAPPPLVTQKTDGHMRRVTTQVFSVLVVAALCVLAGTWWMRRGSQAPLKSAVVQPVPDATHAAANSVSPPQAAAAITPVPGPVNEQLAAQSAPPKASPVRPHVSKPVELPSLPAHKQASGPQLPATLAADDVGIETHVRFTLNQASWIEVYDVDGNRLYYDLAPAGENVQVSGAGPLQVFLGNAPGVSIELNGAAFDQSAYTRSDNTARFKLGSAPPPRQTG
ncbi:MAG TPA: RodZ domain-containing protein [Gammaproteobacteria bacterium]|nr:RodZ domain-containing protein [Gammaproteobacteria bacterium]